MFYHYHYESIFFIPSNILLLKYILSDINIASIDLLLVALAEFIFFYPFTFKLFVCFYLKCVSAGSI